jgi:serine/threonine protein kinase
MNAESDSLRTTFADQLSSFDDKLAGKADDVRMLAEIRSGIIRLIDASSGNEATIRRVLQDQYESGQLRKETFQLVKSMLDRYVTEQAPTSPDSILTAGPVAPTSSPLRATKSAGGASVNPAFSSTDVIPTGGAPSGNPDARIQIGSLLRDRFMLQEQVAGGSMGVVYKALDRRLAEGGSEQPWVAIKVLSPQLSTNANALRALQQEAAKSRCLTHPNIVRFIDFDREEDLYFLVMEWLEGRTLADILDSPDSRIIDFERAFAITRQVGKALAYAHRCGIVHADVKPGNIMMMPNGDAKLFDFGVARVIQKQSTADPDFDPGVLGAITPAYSSMQVLTGEDPVPADDVFSLACLLYRLVAGYRVFGPRNAAEAAEEGMKPQRLDGFSDAQWSALRKALSYPRVTRFGSVEEFLEALGGTSPAPVRNLDVGHHVEFEEESGSVRSVIGVVVLLLLLGFAGYQFGILDELLKRLDLPQDEIQTLAPVVEEVLPASSEEPDVVPAIDMGTPAVSESSAPETTPEPVEAPTVFPPAAAAQPEAATNAALVEEPATGDPEQAADVRAFNVDEILVEPRADVIDSTEPATALVDYSQLPLADVEIPIAPGSYEVKLQSVTLREDSRPVIVDFIRTEPLDVPLMLRLEEIGFSGNRSPWSAGQYTISNNGIVEFPSGQVRARVTLSMASDPLREADQLSTLRVRDAESVDNELATIEVVLEDDDQRRFEAQLPSNTIAFAASQVSVRERDPAVQIDLVRFKPDDSSRVVEIEIEDVTATAGEDYFIPGSTSVTFGPGQRAARVLVPLVQDSAYEGDEAFAVNLRSADAISQDGVHYRVTVIIRDDDGA